MVLESTTRKFTRLVPGVKGHPSIAGDLDAVATYVDAAGYHLIEKALVKLFGISPARVQKRQEQAGLAAK